ncbi:centromere protein U isoform X1 [Fundulus heteroclitus]|uniref:centromere protein U isoform X2 n=1 Tax=Fundulus heteroclitus TaxID=8078 RepID=UPI00165CE08B|nr:centromere protein U isoform X2 [Fundulus heteroclitus]XP_035982924.1 centromere protein U isoform X1 [Fundulus heteroclitus]
MRKRKGTNGPPAPAKRTQTSSPNLSSLDSESFFKGLQQNDSNPLHSTALEDHEDVQAEGQLRRNPKEREESRGGKNQGAAAKRKPAGGGGEEEQRRKSRTETGGKGRRVSLSSGAAQRRQQEEDEGARESADEEVMESEESDPVEARKNSRALLSSDDQSPEGSIWGPSPKRTRRQLLGRKPKGKSAAAPKRAGDGGRKEGRRAGRAVTQLEVVLDAVLDFCQQYRETVESAAVRGAIDFFSDSVRARLLEKISSFKDLRSVKRDNTKVGSLIEAKRLRLLNSKQELMRAERQVMLLQKEKAELQQRLADLRRGQALLHDIRELTARHLRQRRKQPATKETYGASSLAALLLEAKLPQRPSNPPLRVTGRSKKSAPK